MKYKKTLAVLRKCFFLCFVPACRICGFLHTNSPTAQLLEFCRFAWSYKGFCPMHFPSYAGNRIRANPLCFDTRILSYAESGKRLSPKNQCRIGGRIGPIKSVPTTIIPSAAVMINVFIPLLHLTPLLTNFQSSIVP